MTSIGRGVAAVARIAMAIVTAACAASPAEDVQVSQTQSALITNDGTCSTYDCGLNSALIDGVYFSELFKPAFPFPVVPPISNKNHMGMSIRHYYPTADQFALQLPSDDELDVTGARFPAMVAGAVIELENGLERYFVRITKIDHDQEYWTYPVSGRSADETRITTYWFDYTPMSNCRWQHIGALQILACTDYKPLCKDRPDGEGGLAMPALVFEGDRYKQSTLAVTSSPMAAPGTWFNIACAGSLPAKMHLIRRTQAAAEDPLAPIPVPSLRERQAFAHLWAASYCGDGVSYTETGHPIRVRDRGNTLRVDFNVGFADGDHRSVEAVWGSGGALCLNEPRWSKAYTYQEISGHCAELGRTLPPCAADIASTWQQDPRAVAISVNPH